MIEQETGLLPVITFDGTTTWDDLVRVGSPHLSPNGRDRLKTALGQRAQSVVVERHYIDKDYRDTFTNFHAKKFSTPDSRCIRLHFFSAPVDHDTITDAGNVQQSYLGYSIIRPTRPNCVGRTLLTPEGCGVAGAHISLCRELVSIQGTELEVRGFPFISQDADVTACAQSALWMLARYFSNRYRVYSELYPFRLAALTRDYSIGRLFPTSGLYIWQMAEALRQAGYAPLIYDRRHFPDSFDHLMYTYVESGIPVLAAFKDHVVVVFGHVSDFSGVASAVPAAGTPFVLSSNFNKAFIGNDDNASPYQVLGNSVAAGTMPHSVSEVQQFIAALPERVFLPAESFQDVVSTILQRADVGYGRLSPTIASATPCLRLFLTSGRSFKKNLARRGMGSPEVEAVYRNLPLPHFVWVCEISHPALYPRHVLGEILWDATRNAYEPDGWIALHYPEVLIVDAGSALNGPQNLLTFPIASGTNYPIYENNLVRL